MFKIMITGHRPNKLGGYDYDNPIRTYVRKKIREILEEIKKDHPITGISGMAIGADQDFCEVCLELGVEYDAYIPFNGQEALWPPPVKKYYSELIGQAKNVIIVSPGNYTPQKMQTRNKAMANDCDLAIAIWNGSRGGTFNCIKYLESINKKIVKINPSGYLNEH